MNKGNLSTEKHINEKQQINVINKENILINTKKRIKIVFIILVIFNIIFIFTIGFLLYYFLKMKGNSNKNSTEISESLEKKSNSIEATYKIKDAEHFKESRIEKERENIKHNNTAEARQHIKQHMDE